MHFVLTIEHPDEEPQRREFESKGQLETYLEYLTGIQEDTPAGTKLTVEVEED